MLEKIKAHNLEEKVFLVGFVPEAATYLSAFDIFLFPSIKEGLPYVLLEAGAANLPVIASEIGGVPEIIVGGRTGFLIPPKNPRAIAQILSGILRNSLPPRFNPKDIGHALGVHVREHFSLPHMITETERLY
jgi:glycosyltransferase involved in cell wall biosynthesis